MFAHIDKQTPVDSLCLLYSQIDDRQKVIAGHGRLSAARKMGWDKVTAIQLSHLTESQHMACQRTLRAKRKEGDSRKGEVDIGKCEAFKTTGQRNFSLLTEKGWQPCRFCGYAWERRRVHCDGGGSLATTRIS